MSFCDTAVMYRALDSGQRILVRRVQSQHSTLVVRAVASIVTVWALTSNYIHSRFFVDFRGGHAIYGETPHL